MGRRRTLAEAEKRNKEYLATGFMLILPDGRQFLVTGEGKQEIFEGHHLWVKFIKEKQ